eukprot:TRINITY_DN23450_c0_g1_i1.p1 TRINITY_DN23450_c0_g1~~TRINITY_DN23450_c0_g1_i1.p1  ORF type:complete len:378 (-),score=41.65 TRINITY_DN23450_c0_g1_i1:320-1453(-)
MGYFLNLWLESGCPLAALPSTRALVALAAYVTALIVLGALLPPRLTPGTKLADGTRITYNCNGFSVLLALLLALTAASATGIMSPTAIADMGGELFITTLVLSFLLATILFVVGKLSRNESTSLRPHECGSLALDWWLGVQLNPSVLGVDLKFFCLRPGMMGWLLINLSVAAKQVAETGRLSLAMTLYQVFTAVYVLDYFWHEEYMTSTWDIIAEKFGFMLVMGDLVWIPFTFSLQAWYLLRHPVGLHVSTAVLIVFVFLLGYAVFRGANMQKHQFKKNPLTPIWGKAPEAVGTHLLVSGYWGIARHCNYAGDLLLALSYSLPCGGRAFLPYFYPTYLLLLLLWRERRDEARCRTKYKEVWTEYCLRVPWRIFPYVY